MAAWLISVPLCWSGLLMGLLGGFSPLGFIPLAVGLAPIYLALLATERVSRPAGAPGRALGRVVLVLVLNLILSAIAWFAFLALMDWMK